MTDQTAVEASPPLLLGDTARLELLDHVGCGVWVYDGVDTRYVNNALEEITGYSRAELLQPAFFERLIHPDDREMIVARGQARVRGEDVPEEYEVSIVNSSGERRRLNVHARRAVLEDVPVSVVSAVDVTALREAEQTIRDGTGRVVELLHSIPAHVITTDPAGKPTFVNRQWLEFSGQTVAEAMDGGPGRIIHPDDIANAARMWAAAKQSGQPYDIDYRVLDRNAEYRWQNFRIRPLRDGEGNLLGWTSASVDVHDEKELRSRLELANVQLAEAIRAKDEVLGLISHELRTPLTTLLGNARLLRRRGAGLDENTRTEVATDLERDAQRLYAVIENMLVLSRADAGERAELEPARLNRLAEEIIADFRNRHASRAVLFEGPPSLPLAIANPTYYGQILGNLLSNAHKYSPAGSPISVELRGGDGCIQTLVTDCGPGIPEADVAHVFDPFYRSREHSTIYGIGLGLTVCQRLVELQGGKISAANRPGGGASFAFTMPAAALQDDD